MSRYNYGVRFYDNPFCDVSFYRVDGEQGGGVGYGDGVEYYTTLPVCTPCMSPLVPAGLFDNYHPYVSPLLSFTAFLGVTFDPLCSSNLRVTNGFQIYQQSVGTGSSNPPYPCCDCLKDPNTLNCLNCYPCLTPITPGTGI